MEAKLKPCPFCGRMPGIEIRDVEPQGDRWYDPRIERFVLCKCGACMFDRWFHAGFDSDREAVQAWNKRQQ